jgi:hypothetical protein
LAESNRLPPPTSNERGASASITEVSIDPVCKRISSLKRCGSAALLDVGYVLLILRYRPVTHLLCWRLCIALFLSVPLSLAAFQRANFNILPSKRMAVVTRICESKKMCPMQ